MASKLTITGRSTGVIRHVGGKVRSVERDAIADALGADEVVALHRVRGAPISLYALRQALEARVRSTGGRPALDGATRIQKIPLMPEDWSRLEEVAARLARHGVSATAGQVASVMVHTQLQFLGSSTVGHGRGARPKKTASRS